MESLNTVALDIFFIYLTLLLAAAALLLIITCIWRTEGKFDTYLKLIACAFVLLLLKNILLLFGFRNYEYGSLTLRILDFSQVAFFLLSNIELFVIIRNLSGEDTLGE